ncbi:MAG: hypothetical protein DCF14_12895 [Phormidesmis priestleyi]|nr:MAG: hypothetical protein DCF14_12895 [Phormidesmis priestleyi]
MDELTNGFKDLSRLSLSDALTVPFRVFADTFADASTSVGRLLQFGKDGVVEFLKGGFSKFSGGLPTIEGLKDFADRLRAFQKLQNRQEVLRAIADRLNRISKADNDSLNDQAFFDQMQGVMENLFVTAYNPTDVGEDSPLNGLLESKAGGAGYVLAQDLVKDSTAVSVQVFQATLLAAFNEVLYGQAISTTPEAHSTLLKAALELGQTYAKLAPSRETGTVLASDADFGFLDLLWRAQQPGASGRLPGKDAIKAQLQNGVEALGRLLNGVSDPISTLKFLNNLLNAAANSVALNEPRLANSGGGFNPRGDIRSAQFIRELMKFGFEVAKVNPTVTTTGETVISEFLNTLWKGGDDRKGQGGLNQFFEGAKSGSDRVKLLGFGDRLVDAAQLLQGADLQAQKKDAKFLSQLLNLGSSYTALNPITAAGDQPLNFFLSTAYQLSNTRLTAQQLDSFLQSVTNPDVVLFANSDRLKTLNKITDVSLQGVKRSNEFISKTMGVALTGKGISLFNIKDYKGVKNQANPLALVGVERFINIVEKVEAVYKNDTPQEIITRLRRLYYPGDSGWNLINEITNQQAFAALLPNAPNSESDPLSPGLLAERKVYAAELGSLDKDAYAILTAKANENGKEDNPSPYLVIPERNEMIDIGHLLLTLDALLHPGSNAPYSDPYYNVPTIDPASWVADVGVGSVWLTLQQRGTSQEGTPINLKLSSGTPTKEEIDAYYKASAPEADILGDVDGFGLFDRFNNPGRKDQRFSTHLKRYYLQNDARFDIHTRWQTFANEFQAKPIEATFDADDLTEVAKQAWVSRINKFNNLFGDGKFSVSPGGLGRNPNWNWAYTGDMFERFSKYVQEQLKNERNP